LPYAKKKFGNKFSAKPYGLEKKLRASLLVLAGQRSHARQPAYQPTNQTVSETTCTRVFFFLHLAVLAHPPKEKIRQNRCQSFGLVRPQRLRRLRRKLALTCPLGGALAPARRQLKSLPIHYPNCICGNVNPVPFAWLHNIGWANLFCSIWRGRVADLNTVCAGAPEGIGNGCCGV
jgi:hypothetical protein